MVTDLTNQAGAMSADSHGTWPQRAYGLLLLGGLTALALHFILRVEGNARWSEDADRAALAAFLATASIAFSFVVEKSRIRGSAVFALVAGLVVASVLYWSVDFTSWEPWRLVSALLTVSIAAPLFQGWRDGGERRWHIPYVEAHNRAWVNVCLWFAAWAFVGIVMALAWLLAALFQLIGISVLTDLLQKSWFVLPLIGGSFGGAVGMLRDNERIVSAVQKVVMIVLSALAPVLAIALVLFLGALLFTGLDSLWESTKSTTPILLSCVIGALILANAIVRDRAQDESAMRVLRASAMILCVAILPMALMAIVSTWLRINQYGFTPDRLWGLTFTLVAGAYGVAYLVALLRGRRAGWTVRLREANLGMAAALCGLAFLLSTPLLSFGALSARDQMARLERGAVALEKFDFAAMRFDYGPAGKRALKQLAAQGSSPAIRSAANRALGADNRYDVAETQREMERASSMVVHPRGTALPSALRERLAAYDACGDLAPCNVIYRPESNEAIIVKSYGSVVLLRKDGTWINPNDASPVSVPGQAKTLDAAFAAGRVEIRSVNRRQVFVDGKPLGQPFP